MATVKTQLTIADYEALPPAPDRIRELSDGELIEMTFPNLRHNRIAGEMFAALRDYARRSKQGRAFLMNSGFALGPGTLRGPDAAFVKNDRLGGYRAEKYFEGGPDLVVEVMSPNDTASDVHLRLRQFFAAGTQAAWVVFPEEKTLEIWTANGTVQTLGEGDTLTAPELLPGFELRIAELFAED